MWKYQKPNGMIEGWHGDGNFARTTIMYCLWKTQGILPVPWKEKLSLGATFNNNELKVSLTSGSNWTGKVKFDAPRYKDKMHLPVDYPRINQYQQWYTIDSSKKYLVNFVQTGRTQTFEGKDLIDGFAVSVNSGETLLMNIYEIPAGR
jgi:hypothetical protein